MVQHHTGEDRQEIQPSSARQGATERLPTVRCYLEWFAALFLCLQLQASAMMTLWKYLQSITISTNKPLIEMMEIRYETFKLLLYSMTETSASDLRRNNLNNFNCEFHLEQPSPGGGVAKPKGWEGSGGVRYGLKMNLKMEFACAQCWHAGLKSLPDKALKYCCGRARHTWVTVLSFSYSICLIYVLCNLVSGTSGGLKTDQCCWSHHWREKNQFRFDLCHMPSTSLTIMK